MPSDHPEERGLGAYERPAEDAAARAQNRADLERIREARRRLPGGDAMPTPNDR